MCSLGGLALLALAPRLHAQAAATPSTAATTPAAEADVVRLNPFEVTSENDRGFQSGSVGTTARMKVDLADTPVSYTIINRQFIDALGLADMGEAAAWGTNQTFLITDNGGMSNSSAQQYFQRGQTVSTGTANGTGSQRNSFQSASSINDSYNVESFDFGRGPNAALFGAGSGGGGLGGISSTQTKKARLEAPRTSISVVRGSWNYNRATIDYNRPISERFGVRLNTVLQDNDGFRNREFTSTRGITGTLTWKITNTTDFTLEASHEKRLAHSVGTGMDEYVSGWDGVTVFRGPITNAMFSTTATVGATSSGGSTMFGVNPITGVTGLSFSGEANGISRVGNDFLVADLATGSLMNYRNYPITRRADATSRVALWSSTAPNGQYFVRFGNGALPVQGDANKSIQPAFGVGRQNQYHENLQALPADLYQRVYNNSKMREPSYRYTATLDTPTTWSWTKDLQSTLTQRVGSNLFFDISGDVSRVHSGTQNFDQPNTANQPEGGREVMLDINQLLPDGTPNRNFLEPYSTMSPGGREDWTADNGVRFNVVYTGLNLNKWGKYDFNLQVGASQRDIATKGWVLSAATNADNRRWEDTTQAVRFRVNWSDAAKTYYLPTALDYRGNVDWTNPNAPVILPASTVKPRVILGAPQGFGAQHWSTQFQQDRYYLAHTQGKYFNNALVVTADYRRAFAFRASKTAMAQGDLPTNWDAKTPLYYPDAPKDYFTMTYLVKNTSTGAVINTKPIIAATRPRTTDPVSGLSVANPFFLGDRFKNDYSNPSSRSYSDSKNLGVVWNATKWVAPYVNYSTSFTPPNSTSLDIISNVITPTSANGYDMGVNLRLLNNGLTMRLNYYKNTRINDTGNSPVQGVINTLYQANRFDDSDASAAGRNALGLLDLPGNGDYRNTRSDGREIEIGANLGAMRLTLNGGWGFQTNSNQWPLSLAYVPAHAADFLKILQDAGGKLDTTQKPTGAPGAPGLAVPDSSVSGPLLDQTQAINAYNNIWINYQSMLTGTSARNPIQPTINGLLDYSIQSGAAKGLRLGGGVQWQGTIRMVGLGAQTILDPNNPIPTAIDDPSVDNNNNNYVKGSYRTTATMAYTFKLADNRTLAFNLVVTNVLNKKGIIWGDGSINGNGLAVFRQGGGDLTKPDRVPRPALISQFREPIAFKLTGTYSFGGGR